MTTNVVSIASFTGHRTTRYAAVPTQPGETVVAFASPEGDAVKLLATWLAEREAALARGAIAQAAQRREAEALKRFNAAKKAGSHPMLVEKLLHTYWDALEARRSIPCGPSFASTVCTRVALEEALKGLPEATGKRVVAGLTPVQASLIGQTASALRRRRARVQVAA